MTLRECLTAFGFRFVSDTPGELVAWDRDTNIYVYLRPGETRVVYSGGDFPGCRSVGDLRRLINLRGHTVPGDKWYPGQTDIERLNWGRLDLTPLEYPQ